MNERIRELAEQAGIEFDDDFPLEPETIYYLKLSDFEKFAKLVRADEREAIAKEWDGHFYGDTEDIDIGAKIRARGEK